VSDIILAMHLKRHTSQQDQCCKKIIKNDDCLMIMSTLYRNPQFISSVKMRK
jgi:2-polyprenyl-3-methyl-5-hydroxy-6-metoxy-1,4-benzoquinol methylase